MVAPMHNEKWYLLGETVRGASHEQSGKPNQDAIEKSSTPEAAILAIADGHGSEKYFRSQFGSRYAVEVAVAELKHFVDQLPATEKDFTLIKQQLTEMPKRILVRWHEKVDAHLAETPFFTKEEWKHFNNGKALPDVTKNPIVPYGATLLAVLVTEAFIFCLQLGDGDIVFVRDNGQIIKPIAEDKRLLANETTSLCTATAEQDFRERFYRLENTPPALIMLSTDGYANSFSTTAGFLKAPRDMLIMMRKEDGLNIVENDIHTWLTTATTQGSGDDITVGMICHLAALQPPFPELEEPPEEAPPVVVPPVVHTPQSVPRPPGSYLPGQKANNLNEGNYDLTIRAGAAQSPLRSHEARYEQQLLFVSQRGNADYTTIAEALRHAATNAVIQVAPGTYNESLWIDKDVELVAQGEVIIESPVPCLTIVAQRTSVTGFTFRGIVPDREPDRINNAAIHIIAGTSRIVHCDIVSASKVGVWVTGKETWLTLFDSKVHHIRGRGMVFSAAAQGGIKMCKIYQNDGNGIELREASMVTLEDCQVFDGKKRGILLLNNAEVTIVDSTINSNRKYGIQVESGKLTVEKSRITDNGEGGIIIQTQSKGRLIDCSIVQGNVGYGVWVLNGSQVTIQGGSMKSYTGLLCARQSTGELKQYSIMSQGIGVIVTDESSLSLYVCTIDSQDVCFSVERQSRVTATDCKALHNKKTFKDVASVIEIQPNQKKR